MFELNELDKKGRKLAPTDFAGKLEIDGQVVDKNTDLFELMKALPKERRPVVDDLRTNTVFRPIEGRGSLFLTCPDPSVAKKGIIGVYFQK